MQRKMLRYVLYSSLILLFSGQDEDVKSMILAYNPTFQNYFPSIEIKPKVCIYVTLSKCQEIS